MRKITFQNVVDCQAIFAHGESVIFAGKHPWLFRKNGEFIARIKQVCRAWDMLFLANNTVFMDGYGDRSYHFISLENGEVLWSIPQKGKRDVAPRQMAASLDGKKVYYIYGIKKQLYMDVLDPVEKVCTTFSLPIEGGVTKGCFYDAEGSVALLNGVRNMYDLKRFRTVDAQQLSSRWCGPIACFPVMINDTYILLSDLNVINMKAGTTFSLLEDTRKIRKDMYTVFGYDPDRQLLNIRYLGTKSTLIIDCKKRQIAAHYCPITYGQSAGCLIGDEFWIGSSEGIVKRPFPHMDPFPRNFFETV